MLIGIPQDLHLKYRLNILTTQRKLINMDMAQF